MGCAQTTMSQYMHPLHESIDTKPILVQEFRGSSWDHNMAQTLEFVNTKLECKGQLIDIAVTMSNTDWRACIHIYYYRDIAAMKSFGRTVNEYTNHGDLMCAWRRFQRSNWYGSAYHTCDSAQALSKSPRKLFSIKHACGNHRGHGGSGHGGPVTFVLYWKGIESLPTYSEKYILNHWTRQLMHEVPVELRYLIVQYLEL